MRFEIRSSNPPDTRRCESVAGSSSSRRLSSRPSWAILSAPRHSRRQRGKEPPSRTTRISSSYGRYNLRGSQSGRESWITCGRIGSSALLTGRGTGRAVQVCGYVKHQLIAIIRSGINVGQHAMICNIGFVPVLWKGICICICFRLLCPFNVHFIFESWLSTWGYCTGKLKWKMGVIVSPQVDFEKGLRIASRTQVDGPDGKGRKGREGLSPSGSAVRNLHLRKTEGCKAPPSPFLSSVSMESESKVDSPRRRY